jgi:hypothetical protein
VLKLRLIPCLLDPRPDVAFFFLNVVLQGLLQLLNLVHPLVGRRIESINLLDQGLRFGDFLVMMLLPFLQRLISGSDLLGHWAIERDFFDLFMPFNSGLSFAQSCPRSEAPAASIRANIPLAVSCSVFSNWMAFIVVSFAAVPQASYVVSSWR